MTDQTAKRKQHVIGQHEFHTKADATEFIRSVLYRLRDAPHLVTEGEFWEIRISYVHPECWMYRKPGEEFWFYPPTFWRRHRRRAS